MRSVDNAWIAIPKDIVVKEGAEPIDWLPYDNYQYDKFVLREIKNEKQDLIETALVFREGFQVIKGSEFDILFDPDGVQAMAGGNNENFNRGENKIFVIESTDQKKIVSCFILRMMKRMRNVEWLVVVSNDKKNPRITLKFAKSLDEYIGRCGVEMAFAWTNVIHIVTQLGLFKMGYKFRGIAPGMYRIWAGENNFRRTIELFAQKFYNGADKMITKDIKLLPWLGHIKKMWVK